MASSAAMSISYRSSLSRDRIVAPIAIDPCGYNWDTLSSGTPVTFQPLGHFLIAFGSLSVPPRTQLYPNCDFDQQQVGRLWKSLSSVAIRCSFFGDEVPSTVMTLTLDFYSITT